MRIETLTLETEASTGFTHRFTVEYTDLNTVAGLTSTVQLLNTLPARTLVHKAAMELETPFVGASITNLSLQVGWDLLAGTDDPDGLIVATELAGVATEILAADGNGAAFATLRTGFASQEQMDLEALFTAIGANLTALTAGKVHIYLAVTNLAKLR